MAVGKWYCRKEYELFASWRTCDRSIAGLSIASNKDNGVLLLDNILPQQLYLDLSSSFNQAFGKKAKADHLCKRGASRSVGMKYRRLKKIRKLNELPRMCNNVLNAPREVAPKVYPVFKQLKEFILSTEFESSIFLRLGLSAPGIQVARNMMILLDHFGLPSFHAGIPHTDRNAWHATLQIYLPEGTSYSASYGTCFHDLLSSGEVAQNCDFSAPYLPNSGYIFKTSNVSFHSSPTYCYRHCCLERRRLIMANWGLYNVSTTQALLDKQTAERDATRSKHLRYDLTRFI
jgi:hypothetical protein